MGFGIFQDEAGAPPYKLLQQVMQGGPRMGGGEGTGGIDGRAGGRNALGCFDDIGAHKNTKRRYD